MILPLEMREAYLERRRQELALIKNETKASALLLAKKVGHQLKGNAKSFGFEEFEMVAKKLELAAQGQDVYILALAISEYENVLNLCAQRLVLEKSISNKQ